MFPKFVKSNLRFGNSLIFNKILNSYHGKCAIPICRMCGSSSSDKSKKNIREVKGKVAFVTGGTIGIGYSAVEQLLIAGCKHVCMADSNTLIGDHAVKKLAKKFGENKVIYVRTDVRELEELDKAFVKCCETWGQLDIVFNNAGILNEGRWKATIKINIMGLVHGCHLALRFMSKDNGGNGGVVINNASILSLQPMASGPVYTGTKHFVRGYTMSMAMPFHYKKTGVSFLTMCPGVTLTDMVIKADEVAPAGDMASEIKKELGSLPPQNVDCIGKGIVHMIKHGANGSIWVGEGGEFYEVKIPDRTTLKKKETLVKWGK